MTGMDFQMVLKKLRPTYTSNRITSITFSDCSGRVVSTYSYPEAEMFYSTNQIDIPITNVEIMKMLDEGEGMNT